MNANLCSVAVVLPCTVVTSEREEFLMTKAAANSKSENEFSLSSNNWKMCREEKSSKVFHCVKIESMWIEF